MCDFRIGRGAGILMPAYLRPALKLRACLRCSLLLGLALIASDGSLRGSQAGDRHAIRRTGNVVHSDAITELDRARLTTVLAADSDLEIRAWSSGRV